MGRKGTLLIGHCDPKALLLFTIAAAIVCLMISYHDVGLKSRNFSQLLNPSKVDKEVGGGELEHVLIKAAMPDKVVIICTLNEAWIEPGSMFDLFLQSFEIGNQTLGLLKHLMVVCLDHKAFAHCMKLNLHCYWLKTQGIDLSKDASFMTPNYVEIVWRKIDFLRLVLEKGYSFLFTDVDVMWLRNPFPYFYPDTDIQVACDYFLGSDTDLNNQPNVGFIHVRSSNRTIEFYKYWYKSREMYPNKHNQDVFNIIKYERYIPDNGLRIKFLSTAYFGGFCQPGDLHLVSTMHANCCGGKERKIHDLKILLQDWREYLSLPESVSEPPSWTVPQYCDGVRPKKRGNWTT